MNVYGDNSSVHILTNGTNHWFRLWEEYMVDSDITDVILASLLNPLIIIPVLLKEKGVIRWRKKSILLYLS